MVSQTKKTVLVYAMLIMASVWPEGTSQVISKHLQNTAVPVHTGVIYPSSKGYYTPQLQGGVDYYSHPVNAAYWTGQHAQYPHYPPAYPQYPYQQYNPYPYHQPYYYQQPYGYVHHPMGYAQSYGHYPSFDPMYWSTAYHPRQAHYPYYGRQMYYQTHPAYYQGGHYVYPGHYPYYKKPFGAGFLSGNGHGLVKGLIGAALVGAIAKRIG